MTYSAVKLPISAFSRGLDPITDKMLSMIVRDMGNGVDRVESVSYVPKPKFVPWMAAPLDPFDLRVADLILCGLSAIGMSLAADMPAGAIPAGLTYQCGDLLHIMAWGCFRVDDSRTQGSRLTCLDPCEGRALN